MFVKRTKRNVDLFLLYARLFTTPKKVLHCGAHLGEEAAKYRKCGTQVIWVEAQPEKVKILQRADSDSIVVSGVLSHTPDQIVNFYLTSNSLSSSTRKINSNEWGVSTIGTLMLKTITIDQILETHGVGVELAILDLQGNEFESLQSADLLFRNKVPIICEVTEIELYAGQKLLNHVNDFLYSKNYKIVFTSIRNGHGDILAISKERTYKSLFLKLLFIRIKNFFYRHIDG